MAFLDEAGLSYFYQKLKGIFGTVKTVNGKEPDGNGNVKVDAGLPLGHLFAWPFQTPPDGAIQCNGSTYSRTLYADFFAYASTKGWVKTESEWQSIANSNNGYCPWYSSGDGSTTFRTPKFAPFMQVAIASDTVGKYHSAGLPNITGELLAGGNTGEEDSLFSGAFKRISDGLSKTSGAHTNETCNNTVKFSASYSNSVYGRSTTVQPESNEWMICVVVAGQATNIGSVDVANVMSAVAQVQAQIGSIPVPNTYLTKTYHSGSSWYRVYSDGFIMQGSSYSGSTSGIITFPKAFSNTNYSVAFANYAGTCYLEKRSSTQIYWHDVQNANNKGISWIACGY